MRRVFALFLVVLIGAASLLAQTKVTGQVLYADDGEPVIGASVLVKGTKIGVATDLNGKFVLEVPASGKMLVFSYIGLLSKEVKVAPNMVVRLENDVKVLGEVVVTALGITRDEKSVGYSATKIKAEDIMVAKQNDVVQALAGKVAGVQVSSNGSGPGTSNSILIRGVSSVSGNNQPLFVVDGVPMVNNSINSDNDLNKGFDFGNGANLVNPNDVAGMTILKGAAATALYGSRAANGVVMITTKTGKEGNDKLSIDFNSTYEASKVLRLPKFQNEFGMGWDGLKTDDENGSWGPRFDGKDRVYGTIYNNSQQIKPYVALKDNVRDFFETGQKFANDIAFSGNSGKASYYSSFSALTDNGMLPTNVDSYDKYTLALRGAYDFKFVKLSSSLNWADQANSFATSGQGLTMVNSIYQTPRDISLVDMRDLSNPFNTPDYYYTPYGVTNPYYLIKEGSNKFHQNKTYGKMQMDINPMEGLNFTYRFGFDFSNNEQKTLLPKIDPKPGTPNYGQVFNEGQIERYNRRAYELNHDIYGNYHKKISDFDILFTAGVNANERYNSLNSAVVTGLSIPGFNDLSNSASTPTVKEEIYKRRLVGMYGDLQLNWKEQIFLGITARNDWSSTLPIDNNSFFYPGVTASWVFTELLENNDALSFGKLRLAYGQTGNDADYYMTNPYYVSGFAYNEFTNNDPNGLVFPFRGVNAYRIGAILASQNLSPEITSEFEVGLNMNFFNGRIELDAAYYDKKSDKQIFSLSVDPASGYSSMNTNLGKVGNRGIELLLNTIPVKIGGFTWNLGVNFTKNKNKVISLPKELGGEIIIGGFGGFNLMAREGHQMGEFRMTQPMRTTDGKVIVNAQTGLPVENPEAQYSGNVNHDFEMGVTNSFNYKGVTLTVNCDWRKGGKMYSRTKDINYFTGNAYNTLYNERRPFIIPNSVVQLADGSYAENTKPIAVSNIDEFWGAGGAMLDEAWLIDRSYFKIRNVVLSYDLPKQWVSKLQLQGLRVSVYGNNLLLITPNDNIYIDPEVTSFGNDFAGRFGEFSANPTARQFGMSLNVKY